MTEKLTYEDLQEWSRNSLINVLLESIDDTIKLKETVTELNDTLNTQAEEAARFREDHNQLIDDLQHLEDEADANRCIMRNLAEQLKSKEITIEVNEEHINNLNKEVISLKQKLDTFTSK